MREERFCASNSIKALWVLVPFVLVSGLVVSNFGPSLDYFWSSSSTSGTTTSSSSSISDEFSSLLHPPSSSPPVSSLHQQDHDDEEPVDHHIHNNQRDQEEKQELDAAALLTSQTSEISPPPDSAADSSDHRGASHQSVQQDTRPPRPKQITNLDKVEAGLQKARRAIKQGNQTLEEEIDDTLGLYVPTGPMYWNARSFHRSYREMEKQFKVYVYEEGEPPVFHNGPCKSIYAMEGNFIHRMEIDPHFRTKDPDQAHIFFLPFSVAMLVQFVYVRDSHDFAPIRRTVTDYVNLIANKYPYWNRSLGADHFMLACHDWGPETSFSVPFLGSNSIRALCNANTSERFNPVKDVSFPEINLRTGTTNGYIGGPSPSKRSILAFFAGGVHGPIRPILLNHWEKRNDEHFQVHQYLPKGVSYYDMMRKSKFCLCPSGYEVASPRVVEAIYAGCVPVLISDHYVPPFSDVLNWKSFSVEVPVSRIPDLKTILESISSSQYIRMQRRVLQVRKHFEVNSPPRRYDVFHMILHSIWLRRLNVRIQGDPPFPITG